jgi:hypothetical protein
MPMASGTVPVVVLVVAGHELSASGVISLIHPLRSYVPRSKEPPLDSSTHPFTRHWLITPKIAEKGSLSPLDVCLFSFLRRHSAYTTKSTTLHPHSIPLTHTHPQPLPQCPPRNPSTHVDEDDGVLSHQVVGSVLGGDDLLSPESDKGVLLLSSI